MKSSIKYFVFLSAFSFILQFSLALSPKTYTQNQLELDIREITQFVEANIKPSRMSYAELFFLGQKTPKQLLEDKKTSITFPCLDKVVVIAKMLVERGYETYITTRKIMYPYFGSVGLHFTVEVTDGHNKYRISPTSADVIIEKRWEKPYEVYPSSKLPPVAELPSTSILVKRERVNDDIGNIKALTLAGIRGRIHYLILARVNPYKFIKYVLGRTKPKTLDLIEMQREAKMSA